LRAFSSNPAQKIQYVQELKAEINKLQLENAKNREEILRLNNIKGIMEIVK